MFQPDFSCSDCGRDCNNVTDWLSMFNSNLCQSCEAVMFREIADEQAFLIHADNTTPLYA
ncbi:MAG: hypothetical protein WC763_05125 [Candidatus Paceibacterota bacterium]